MFHLDAYEVEFMGRLLTFDVVTAYGLLCAAVFMTGFVYATRYEKNRVDRGNKASGPATSTNK